MLTDVTMFSLVSVSGTPTYLLPATSEEALLLGGLPGLSLDLQHCPAPLVAALGALAGRGGRGGILCGGLLGLL